MGVHYYKVPIAVGEDGTVRPDLPPDVSWVGNADGVTYFVKTNIDLAPAPGLVELTTPEEVAREAQCMGLVPEEVLNLWAVGGEA